MEPKVRASRPARLEIIMKGAWLLGFPGVSGLLLQASSERFVLVIQAQVENEPPPESWMISMIKFSSPSYVKGVCRGRRRGVLAEPGQFSNRHSGAHLLSQYHHLVLLGFVSTIAPGKAVGELGFPNGHRSSWGNRHNDDEEHHKTEHT